MLEVLKVHLRNLDGWRENGIDQFFVGSISRLGFDRFGLRMLCCTPFVRCMKHMFTAEVVPDDHSSLLTNLFLVLGNYDGKCTE